LSRIEWLIIEDKEDYEKMALTSLHFESGKASRGISQAKYRRNALVQGLGKNDCLGHGFSTSEHEFDSLTALNL